MGQTSRTTPRAASSATRAGDSTARIPCRSRSAWRTSRHPRMEASPATSPACGTDPTPPSRAIAESYRPSGRGLGLLDRPTARDVRRQPDLDAEPFTGLIDAVAIPREHLRPVRASPNGLGWREDRLEVHRSVTHGFPGVVDRHLPEVVRGPERSGREQPDLEEVGEVTKAVELGELGLARDRQRGVVSSRDLEEPTGPDAPFEVHMKLDPGRLASDHRRIMPCCVQRSAPPRGAGNY